MASKNRLLVGRMQHAGKKSFGVGLTGFLKSFVNGPVFGGGEAVDTVDLRDEGQDGQHRKYFGNLAGPDA